MEYMFQVRRVDRAKNNYNFSQLKHFFLSVCVQYRKGENSYDVSVSLAEIGLLGISYTDMSVLSYRTERIHLTRVRSMQFVKNAIVERYYSHRTTAVCD